MILSSPTDLECDVIYNIKTIYIYVKKQLNMLHHNMYPLNNEWCVKL